MILKALDVNLGKTDEVVMVPLDAMGFVHLRARDLWYTDAVAVFWKVLDGAVPELRPTQAAARPIRDGTVSETTGGSRPA